MSSRVSVPIFLMVLGFVCPLQVGAKEKVSLIQKEGGSKIQELDWLSKEMEVQELKDSSGKTETYVQILGTFKRPFWTLLHQRKMIRVSPTGDFTIEVPVSSKSELILEVMAIGPGGDIEQERITLKSEKPESEAPEVPEVKEKRFSLGPGIGVSLLNFHQTSFGTLREWGITAKLSGDYPMFERSSFGGSVFYTAFLLSSVPAGYQLRFFGANLRMSYEFPSSSRWRIRTLGGIYYTTSISKPTKFGYRSLAGPQIMQWLGYVSDSNRVLGFYVKVSPVVSGFSFPSLSNSEVALGASYQVQRINISLDISALHFQVKNQIIDSTSASLGLGFAL